MAMRLTNEQLWEDVINSLDDEYWTVARAGLAELKKRGEDINISPIELGRASLGIPYFTPLAWALDERDARMTRELLEAGCDPNYCDGVGRWMSGYIWNYDCLKLMLDYGCCQQSEDSQDPLVFSVIGCFDDDDILKSLALLDVSVVDMDGLNIIDNILLHQRGSEILDGAYALLAKQGNNICDYPLVTNPLNSVSPTDTDKAIFQKHKSRQEKIRLTQVLAGKPPAGAKKM